MVMFDEGKMLAPADTELGTTPDRVLWACIRNCQEAVKGHEVRIAQFEILIDKQMAELERRAKARSA